MDRSKVARFFMAHGVCSRDYRSTWQLNQTEPVAGNYYPVNSRIYIQVICFSMLQFLHVIICKKIFPVKISLL